MRTERFTLHSRFHLTTSNDRTDFRPIFFGCEHTLITRIFGLRISNDCQASSVEVLLVKGRLEELQKVLVGFPDRLFQFFETASDNNILTDPEKADGFLGMRIGALCHATSAIPNQISVTSDRCSYR